MKLFSSIVALVAMLKNLHVTDCVLKGIPECPGFPLRAPIREICVGGPNTLVVKINLANLRIGIVGSNFVAMGVVIRARQ
jgi:hypothetical protein